MADFFKKIFLKSYNLLWCVINSFLRKKVWNQSFFVSQGKKLDNSVTQLMYKFHILYLRLDLEKNRHCFNLPLFQNAPVSRKFGCFRSIFGRLSAIFLHA